MPFIKLVHSQVPQWPFTPAFSRNHKRRSPIIRLFLFITNINLLPFDTNYFKNIPMTDTPQVHPSISLIRLISLSLNLPISKFHNFQSLNRPIFPIFFIIVAHLFLCYTITYISAALWFQTAAVRFQIAVLWFQTAIVRFHPAARTSDPVPDIMDAVI
jgi:hypothetical protein